MEYVKTTDQQSVVIRINTVTTMEINMAEVVHVHKFTVKPWFCDNCNPDHKIETKSGEPHRGCELWDVLKPPPEWKRQPDGQLWCPECIKAKYDKEYKARIRAMKPKKQRPNHIPKILKKAFSERQVVTRRELECVLTKLKLGLKYWINKLQDRGYIEKIDKGIFALRSQHGSQG